MSSNKSKTNRRRWIWLGAAIALALVAMVVVRVKQVDHIQRQDATPWALDVAVVKKGTVARGFPVLATITTKGEITVTGQVGGTILKMGPREGVRVKAGDFLAKIDTRELQDQIGGIEAKLAAAKAELSRRNNELEREKKLFDEGGSSATSLESYRTAAIAAQNNVRALNHQIEAMKIRKDYGNVVAPAEGIIAARLRETGDVCLPGHPLYRMTVAKGARVRVKLPQSIVEQITPGAALELLYGKDTLVVKLNRIYPSVDALALGAAEADLSTPPFGMASGSRVAGRVILTQSSGNLLVPPDAVISGNDAQIAKLFKVEKQEDGYRLKSIPVTIDLKGRNAVAVQGSLSAGDRVVVAHESVLLKLQDNDPVVVNEGGAL